MSSLLRLWPQMAKLQKAHRWPGVGGRFSNGVEAAPVWLASQCETPRPGSWGERFGAISARLSVPESFRPSGLGPQRPPHALSPADAKRFTPSTQGAATVVRDARVGVMHPLHRQFRDTGPSAAVTPRLPVSLSATLAASVRVTGRADGATGCDTQPRRDPKQTAFLPEHHAPHRHIGLTGQTEDTPAPSSMHKCKCTCAFSYSETTTLISSTPYEL